MIEVDENELKDFVIEFNQSFKKIKYTKSPPTEEKPLEDKFRDMICSETFIKEIDENSLYFDSIDLIMYSPIYKDFMKREIIIKVIREYYYDTYNEKNSGAEIYNLMVKEIIANENINAGFTINKTKFYLKILISWGIFNCDIYNENLKGDLDIRRELIAK